MRPDRFTRTSVSKTPHAGEQDDFSWPSPLRLRKNLAGKIFPGGGGEGGSFADRVRGNVSPHSSLTPHPVGEAPTTLSRKGRGQHPNTFMLRTLLLFAFLALTTTHASAQPKAETASSKGGVVVCVSPPAAEVGLATLKKGGNAVDAAVATAFAMAVTWPEAGNIGGGGFMMVAPPGKDPTCFEYRETAPASAKVDLFADGKVTALDHKAAGVPGTVRGLSLAHSKHGKLAWKDVVMPAVELAEKGFTVNAVLAGGLNRILADPKTTNAEFKRVFGKPDGSKWQAGDTLVQKDLGHTLRLIAEKGPDAFYKGELADLLAKEMKDSGGLITKSDLEGYKANERKPIHTTFRGYNVYGPPPPSSGGVALCEMLNILENFDLKKLGRESPEAMHYTIEAMKRAYADRAQHLGDPDFTKIPPELTTKEYAKKLAASIDPKKATPSAEIAPEIPLDKPSDSTTHFSVIDKDGFAVTNTYTLENSYGNRVVVRGGGYILNNEMTDFNHRPGITDREGSIGTKLQSDRTRQADALLHDARDCAEGRQARAHHRQPRRADDHQYRAMRRTECDRIRYAHRRSSSSPATASPVVPGCGPVRECEARLTADEAIDRTRSPGWPTQAGRRTFHLDRSQNRDAHRRRR